MSIRPLSSDLQEKAKKELNEVPSEIKDHLNNLRQWLLERPHLQARTDDQWLLSFLRGCKFNIEKTKDKLEFFYLTRSKTPEFFSNRDPLLPEVQEVLKRGILVPVLNSVDPAGPPLLMVRWERVDLQKVPFVNLVKVSLMSLDILINESDRFIIAGQQIVQDYKGFSFRYMMQMTPGLCKKSISCLQSAYPTRIKGVHFINAPAYFRILFNIVYPFLTKKLKSRLHVYGADPFNNDGIYKHIDYSDFPSEYGGKGGPADELASNMDYGKRRLKVTETGSFKIVDNNNETCKTLAERDIKNRTGYYCTAIQKY